MKKLMFTAAAVAMAGGAFAAPLVYDYKASVKHMYLKRKVIVPYAGALLPAQNQTPTVYLKVIRSANLKGYLVMDQDGVTSATISGSAATCFDYGRNRGFLVVANENLIGDAYYGAKILPAVLDAKYIDQRYDTNPPPTTGVAEGTLFCGGDSIACVRTQLDVLAGTITERAAAPAANTPGMAAFSDYAWTSVMLFGMYNSPLWAYDENRAVLAGPFDGFETAWDANLPAALQRGFGTAPVLRGAYHDTWMNGAGFGKYVRVNPTGLCCGFGESGGGITLDTLSGAVKGGLWLCTDNAIDVEQLNLGNYNFFDSLAHPENISRWDDQFNTPRLAPAGTFAPDGWQNDLWQDGAMEQETTDVISGTWSIKLNQKFLTKAGVLQRITVAEVQRLFPGVDATKTGAEAIAGINLLCSTLKSAALKLNPAQNIADGTDIHLYQKTDWSSKSTNLPFLTPAFCAYFGLDAWN